jgi:hypothetical protein
MGLSKVAPKLGSGTWVSFAANALSNDDHLCSIGGMSDVDRERQGLDEETLRELDYATADFDAPARNVEHGSRTYRSRGDLKTPRRGLMPIEALTPEGDRLLEQLCAGIPSGRLSENDSPEYQQAIQRLAQFAFPIGDVPVGSCTTVRGESQSAAYLLVTTLLRAARGKAVSSELAAALPAAFDAVFGVRVGQAWILPFVKSLRRAALQLQNWERRVARLGADEKARFKAPPDLLEQANGVIAQTRMTMDRWPGGGTLPNWVSVELTAYLIPRLGFGTRGGGASRVIAEKNLFAILSQPALLIKDLERSDRGRELWAPTIRMLQDELQRRLPE